VRVYSSTATLIAVEGYYIPLYNLNNYQEYMIETK